MIKREYKENSQNTQSSNLNSNKINELIIQFYDNNEREIEEIGPDEMDFKLLIFDRLYYLSSNSKDMSLWKKFCKLINKIFKKDYEEFGLKAIRFLLNIINVQYEKICESNLRVYINFN